MVRKNRKVGKTKCKIKNITKFRMVIKMRRMMKQKKRKLKLRKMERIILQLEIHQLGRSYNNIIKMKNFNSMQKEIKVVLKLLTFMQAGFH